MMTPEQIDRLLRLTAFEYTDAIWWRLGDPVPDGVGGWTTADPDELIFLVNCSDVFTWGTADCERIDDESDLNGLEQAIWECEVIMGRYRGADGFLLWVARKREMRPQGAFYDHLDKELWHLFDACGPVRETDTLNPKSRPA